MTSERTTLLGHIVSAGIALSRSAASFVLAADPILGNRAQRRITSDLLLQELTSWRESDDGIAHALVKWRGVVWDDPSARISDWERRLAAMTLQAWPTTPARSGRRPDILAMTSALLANPSQAHTFPIVRYALVLALRSLYGIENERESLEALRSAYEQFSQRMSEQQRRRVTRHGRGADSFLIDIVALEGHAYRALLGENFTAYCAEFKTRPFGVNAKTRQRHFASTQAWPEIHGRQPDFSTILSLAFNQPTGVPGLDDVVGGLMPAMATAQGFSPGGVITLLAGPPGSGKTTLAMSIASRLAELGSEVAYISAEESSASLDAKRISVVEANGLARSLWPDATFENLRHNLVIHESGSIRTLHELVQRIEASTTPKTPRLPLPGRVFVDFQYVIIIDSVTVLLQEEERSLGPRKGLRTQLSALLNRLRAAGACVFLIGERSHAQDSQLAFLVDNVFVLDFEDESTGRHPLRILSVEKTRLQISFRGRHVLHLSRFDGVSVSPSLHAMLRLTGVEVRESPQQEQRTIIWTQERQQAFLPGLAPEQGSLDTISLRTDSHTLVYGWGTSGKARLALMLAYETRVPAAALGDYLKSRSVQRRTRYDSECLDTARVLVVSFLYGAPYYARIVEELYRARKHSEGRSRLEAHLDVEALYPGYLDPETLVKRIANRLTRARREGRPYTAVVIDGIHNMLLQYPLLSRESLLWPTIFRILRREHVMAVSTFTFFQVATPADILGFELPGEQLSVPSEAEKMFHHLLVSSCDYTLLVAKHVDPAKARTATILRTTTLDIGKERNQFYWDAENLRCSADAS
jgi:hypothetical protein